MPDPIVDPSVIALAGVIVAGVAAVASPVGDFLVARSRHAHEHRQAREDRRQRRLEATYSETSEYLLIVRDYVRQTEPIMSFGEPQPPTFPESDVMRHREAGIVIYGSREVLSGLEKLTKLTNTFQANVWHLRSVREHGGQNMIEVWEQVESTRKEIHGQIEKLLRQMNEELVGMREQSEAGQ